MTVFATNNFNSLGSATNAAAVTKSDTTVLSPTRALWVGGAGDLAVTMLDGTTATFVGVPAGTLLPLCVTKVMDMTTTTSMVAIR